MNEPNQDMLNLEIAEIEYLVRNFKKKFAVGTASADDFLTISELELMWGELQDRTNNIYSDMIRKLMSEVDEGDLIRKKKALSRMLWVAKESKYSSGIHNPNYLPSRNS